VPDANGRFKGISVPRLPWQEPQPEPAIKFYALAGGGWMTDPIPGLLKDVWETEHTACGTPDCCGECPTASGRM
jgi:hypothetical protein